jgi:hypothetical protein
MVGTRYECQAVNVGCMTGELRNEGRRLDIPDTDNEVGASGRDQPTIWRYGNAVAAAAMWAEPVHKPAVVDRPKAYVAVTTSGCDLTTIAKELYGLDAIGGGLCI